MSLNPTESSNRQRFLPKISVIVPIYNGEADLLDLLGCLQAQTYAADRVEYLLVDYGSRDRTATLLQTAVQEAASLEITLRYLQEDRIQSSYAARNTGIKAASGEILAFTDAIGLFGDRARAAGQREAQLPEKAREKLSGCKMCKVLAPSSILILKLLGATPVGFVSVLLTATTGR